jgi:hypothetical protein
MIYTKHTAEIGQNVVQHFMFACSIAYYLLRSSVALFIHGITGGLYSPEKYSLKSVVKFLKEREAEIEARRNDR